MWFQRAWEALESVLGLFATFFVGFAAPTILAVGVLVSLVEQRWTLSALAVLGVVITGKLALLVARAAGDAVYRKQTVLQTWPPAEFAMTPSLAVNVACRIPQIPFLLRPLLSLWWLVHFVAGAVLGFGISRLAIRGLNQQSAFVVILALVLQVGFLFAVNLYLLMAISVFIRDAPKLEKLWGWRFPLDLTVSLTILLFEKFR